MIGICMQELLIRYCQFRYGDVVEISKDEWVSQVTDASKTGVCVCVHLYNDSLVECQLMDECLLNLAPRFPYVKFLKIRATSAVENWPEKNLPTLFVYKAGELKEQLITLRSVGGKSMKPEGAQPLCLNFNMCCSNNSMVCFMFRFGVVVGSAWSDYYFGIGGESS